MAWLDDITSACDRWVKPLVEAHGFECIGLKRFGRGAYFQWDRALSARPLAPEERLHLMVWWEWDGPVFLYTVLSMDSRRLVPRWSHAGSLYVNEYVRKRLRGRSETHVPADNLDRAYAEIGRQLEAALPHLDAMIEALRSKDPDLLMR